MSNGGWTLISRYSNADTANWMQYSGSWWYDRTTSYGSVTSPSNNYDMISPAFWLVRGSYIKITRSDDSSNTALLYLAVAQVEELSEALLPVSGTLDMVTSGTATHAVDPVMHTLGDAIHQQWVSAMHPAAAIFKALLICHSGVTGVAVTEL